MTKQQIEKEAKLKEDNKTMSNLKRLSEEIEKFNEIMYQFLHKFHKNTSKKGDKLRNDEN